MQHNNKFYKEKEILCLKREHDILRKVAGKYRSNRRKTDLDPLKESELHNVDSKLKHNKLWRNGVKRRISYSKEYRYLRRIGKVNLKNKKYGI